MAGNGSTKFNVTCVDMGGWVRVAADGTPANPKDLAAYLSHVLAQWLRQNPHLRLISVAAVDRNGETVEMHGWFEQHRFPDKSSLGPGS